MKPDLQFSGTGKQQSNSIDTCSLIPLNCHGQGHCFDRNRAPRGCFPEPVQHATCENKPVTPLRPWSATYVGLPKSGCLFGCMAGYHEASCGPACIMCYQNRDKYESSMIILCLFLACCAAIIILHRCCGTKLYAKKNRMLLEMNCPAISATKTSMCCICLSTMEPGESVRQLPCSAGGFDGHQFHIDCIDSWLERSLRCPLCNADCSALVQFYHWPMFTKQHASPTSEPYSGSDTEELTAS